MFGRRFDGRRLDNIDPIVRFMPFIMKTRNDAQNLAALSVDYEPLAEYIKKRSRDGVKVSFLSLFVAAYVRAVSQYPDMNRFIINKQVFARKFISVSLAVLRNTHDKENLDEALIKMEFEPTATIDEVSEQIDTLIKDASNEEADNGAVNFANALLKIRPLVTFVVWLLRIIDRYGLLPLWLEHISPFHCSMFITNMASIGMPPIYHHLYNFGNTSVFIAMGKFEKQPIFKKDGVSYKTVIPMWMTTDERICGGASYARAFAYFKKLLENPELLEERPEHVNNDIDFSEWRAKRAQKAAKKAAKKAKKAEKKK